MFLGANIAYPPDAADVWFQVMFTSIVGAVALVGALLTVRVEHNPIGPLLLASGCITATTIALGTWAFVMSATGTVPPAILALAAIANDFGFLLAIVILLIFVPLIFPDGRLLSRRWRLLVGLAVSALVAVVLASILTPGRLERDRHGQSVCRSRRGAAHDRTRSVRELDLDRRVRWGRACGGDPVPAGWLG